MEIDLIKFIMDDEELIKFVREQIKQAIKNYDFDTAIQEMFNRVFDDEWGVDEILGNSGMYEAIADQIKNGVKVVFKND